MGWDIRRLQTTSTRSISQAANGLYQFARAQTALPTNLTQNRSCLREPVARLTRLRRTVLRHRFLLGNIRYGYHAAYFQDNWKVNPRLTLNLGMRYDIPINWHDQNGDYSAVGPDDPESDRWRTSWRNGVLR